MHMLGMRQECIRYVLGMQQHASGMCWASRHKLGMRHKGQANPFLDDECKIPLRRLLAVQIKD